MTTCVTNSSSFEWKGRTWEFDAVDSPRVKKEFVDQLIDDARRQMRRSRDQGKSTAAEYDEERKDLLHRIWGQAMKWDGSICIAALQQTVGMKQIVLIMLRAKNKDVTTEVIDELWRDAGLIPILLTMGVLVEEKETADGE